MYNSRKSKIQSYLYFLSISNGYIISNVPILVWLYKKHFQASLWKLAKKLMIKKAWGIWIFHFFLFMIWCYSRKWKHPIYKDGEQDRRYCVKANFLHIQYSRSWNSECITTERCIRQLALTVEKNVMFLSNQTVQGQFIAENATQNVDHQEDIKLIS